MIGDALACVVDDLNLHLAGARETGGQAPVKLGGLGKGNHSPPDDVVVLALTALEEEKNIHLSAQALRGESALARKTDPVFLNLHVVFAATHRRYHYALNALASVVRHLQAKPCYDERTTAKFPAGLGQLSFTMEKLHYADLNQIWGYLGSDSFPSAYYTVRALGLGAGQINAVVPTVNQVENS